MKTLRDLITSTDIPKVPATKKAPKKSKKALKKTKK